MTPNQEIEKWNHQGIELNKGASNIEIETLEKEIEFKFPKDFKDLYYQVNGFKDGDWTANMFSLFSTTKIKKEYFDIQNEPNFVPIMDWLIASHFIGYLKDKQGIYTNSMQENSICKNLEELFQLIEQDSELLY